MSGYFSFADRVKFRADLEALVCAVQGDRSYRDELLAVGDWVKGRGCPGDAVVESLFVAFTSPEGCRFWASGGGLLKISLRANDPFTVVHCSVDEWFIGFVKADAFTRQVAAVLR